ncbi:MAG: hypothetical protein ABR572_01300 [Cryomorphaceae bacterium]
MIFIFDWGYRTVKHIGPLAAEDLPEMQGTAEFYSLVRETEWFRLFFIPVIPTAVRYFLENSESEERWPVDKAFVEKYSPLAELNQRAVRDEVTEEEFNEARSSFFKSFG